MSWITCRFCGEKRDTSNRYTSPANVARDARQWSETHETGKCLRLQFTVTRIVHPHDCDTCQTHVESAITTALATGSTGGSSLEESVMEREARNVDRGGHYYTHGATVARLDPRLVDMLRNDHHCEVRRTSSRLSPVCGKPAYTTWWIDGDTWTCPEHDQTHGVRATLDSGVLPANRRAVKVGKWAALG